ncbi:site-specific DNA-methyltransferase [Xanthomonas hortorum pv. vitians]|uniref:site-specific DNA-methyltransferase n=1 Tax=Xanthomonas hortorum TaxID=56454 RepID=UPI0012A89EE4|nr:site-specific DNA-methyltransferase [Xanthomonas hortorum]MCC8555236.1 site-specific DNA-methyltransferase [Xanthomonas hortorum pv. gardneri]MCE4279259.1 site-specific DNA-methyltransferase [Xanthomonas hortorum pv. vitians]MCE4284408.1 site-specific DNA-methyltransferase [Xanthomonas hortorum pv. vitians]MCE4360858.1 site-specific DNA-methyltransferase [Xanthomonas hortorum]QEW16471.1 site-specific DNA-methyltransferase [Xanthomonas hortorum]
MEKLKMHSPNLTEDNIARIRDLFPGCVTEARGEDGSVKLAVDFDQLRQELSSSIVEGPQERYHLNWPGKREALLTANAPIAKTLRPVREESVDFDTTKNLFIEGDNLDALKLLQETYLGKVKMIYIDPPYNTGKDFIYVDDFTEDAGEYLRRSNQKDEYGNRLIANSEANGRMHSDWLTMMYSRIRLARNLLCEDGAIFISINHKEVANIRKITDEVFGEENMLCLFAWRTDGNFDNQAKFKYCHEYILAYAKQESEFPHPLTVDPNTPKGSKIFRAEIRNTIVKNGPKNPPSEITLPVGFPAAFDSGTIARRTDSWPHLSEEIYIEDGKITRPAKVYSGWSSKELLEEFIEKNCQPILDAKGQETSFELSSSGAIEAVKVRGEPSHVISMLTGFGGPQKATADLSYIGVPFDDYPKPVELIKYLASMIRGNDFIAVDFFAGSATTAQSILQLNAEDEGSRRFIMVQLPEPCNENTEAFKAGHKNIADISKERIRRVAEKIGAEVVASKQELDLGFRVLKIDTSNMADVYYSPDALDKANLDMFVDNIKPDRTAEDLLFQVMLDWGVDFALSIEKKAIQGKDVFFVDGDALAACFDAHSGIDEAFVKELATHTPLRAVFRDAGFKDSAVKINVEQIFKLLSPSTEVKSI